MTKSNEQLLDVALVAGTILRLTRLVVTDDLGDWWIRRPLIEQAVKHNNQRAIDYLEGLDCPFCVGYWLTAGTVGSAIVANKLGGRWKKTWRVLATTFAANYVLAHVTARLDTVEDEDESEQDNVKWDLESNRG